MPFQNRTGAIYIVRTKPKSGPPVDLTERIFAFSYDDESTKADKCTLTVDNFDLRNFDDPVFAKGVILEVRWGYPGDMSPAREVIIQKVTGGQLLSVEALDKGILANKETKSRTWDKVTHSDVAKIVAKEEGFDDRHIQETTVVHDHVCQIRETNAALLKRLAGREGFEFFIDFDGLHWHPKNLGQKPVFEFVWFADKTGTLKDFKIKNDVTAKPAAITQKGRDPITKKDFEVKADDESTKRTGAPILEAIDPRTASTHDTVATGTSVTSPATIPNEAAAKSHVDGQFKKAQITLVEIEGSAIGVPRLVGKTMVKISNIRSMSGNYYVTKVKHSLSGGNYDMSFEAKRDGRDTTKAKPVPSKASPNTQDPSKSDALEPVETINGRTATTIFTDTAGRSTGVR